MPVPTNITDLSSTAASNSPAGGDSIGTSLDDYLRAAFAFIRQTYDTSVITASSTAGTSTYTATGSPAPTAYTAGQLFAPLLTNTSTATPVTFNFNGLGAKTVKKSIGGALVDLAIGDFQAGTIPLLRYDGTNLVLIATRSYSHGADIASAATLNLDTATGDVVDVTGTTGITAITLSEGQERTVRFTGSLLLTNGASLVLPESANIQTAAGDFAIFRGYASGVVRCCSYQRLNRHGSDVASAGTLNLDTATGDVVDVTGTTTITAITLADGRERTVRFTGALTLTNGASLVLPGAANITTAAGDYAVFRGYAAGVVRCVDYTKAAFAPFAGQIMQQVRTEVTSSTTGTTTTPFDDTIPQITEGNEYMTLAITPLSSTSKLLIQVVANFTNSATVNMTVALHQDATANALAAVPYSLQAGAFVSNVSLTHQMTSGTTSSTTFRVRIGGSSAGTTTFNGTGGTRLYGGVCASSIVITEYAA